MLIKSFRIPLVDPFDCGATTGCGSEGWFISANSNLKQYITGGTCADSTPFSSIPPCPPASYIAPCSCQVSNISPCHLSLTCANTNQDNDAIQSFITSGNVSAIAALVDSVDFSNNSLTKVPTGLVSTFPAVVSVTLSGNKITSLVNGDLSDMKNVVLVDVSRNEIQTIASGSLPGETIRFRRLKWPNNCYKIEILL